MNRCHALGRLAVIVAGLAGAVVAFAAEPAVSAAVARASPRRARLFPRIDDQPETRADATADRPAGRSP